MNARSRSTLFLMELLAAVTIFAVCAAVCAKLFIASFLMANDTRDMNNALLAAKNGAEIFKVYADPAKTAAALSGADTGEYGPRGVVYYDKKWLVCGEADAVYALRLRALSARTCELSVEKINEAEIISFTIAANRVTRDE